MKFATYLKEEYLGLVQSRILKKGVFSEVYVNPSVREMKLAANKDKEVRYLVDFDRDNIYVWSADGIFHADFIKYLGYKIERQACGIGEIIRAGRIVTIDCFICGIKRSVVNNEKRRRFEKYLDWDSFMEKSIFIE